MQASSLPTIIQLVVRQQLRRSHSSQATKKVFAFEVDLTSFKSVRALAASVLEEHPRIDVALCDAGTGNGGLPLTGDGFEPVMQINYISHFLLEQLLLPALRAARGKLIHTSSLNSHLACKEAGLPDNCIDDVSALEKLVKTPTSKKNSYYGISKLMMIYNARELALRESSTGVRAYSIRPGLVDTPLTKKAMNWLAKWILCRAPICAAGKTKDGKCARPCPMPEQAGACSPTFVAVTDLPQNQDGSLYFQCEIEAPPAWGNGTKQEQNQKALYDMSLKWTNATDSQVIV